MTTVFMSVPACSSCDEIAARLEREGGEAVCPQCKAVLYKPDDAPPTRARSARREIAALARWGHLLEGKAAGFSASTGGSDPTRGRPDHVDGHSVEIARACRAQERLAEMRRHPHPEGRRYADVLWLAHGHRGEVTNRWESCAAQIAKHCARAGEVDAWVDALGKKKGSKLTEPMRPIAFGNALLALATDAYETDRWAPVLKAPLPTPLPELKARQRWLQNLAEQWEQARARILGPREIDTPVSNTERNLAKT